MSWPNDWLTGLFLFLFAFGLIFSVVSLLFNVGDDLPGFDLDGDGAGHHTGAPSAISLSTVMIFLTWFGAAGYIARTWGGLAAWIVLPLATIAGLVGGLLVYLFMAKVIWRGQSQLNPADYDPRGISARVTSAIRPGGTGEIVYMLDNKRRVDGARSLDSAAIATGAEVTIIRYTGGIAYVAPPTWVDQPFIGERQQGIEELVQPPSRE